MLIALAQKNCHTSGCKVTILGKRVTACYRLPSCSPLSACQLANSIAGTLTPLHLLQKAHTDISMYLYILIAETASNFSFYI